MAYQPIGAVAQGTPYLSAYMLWFNLQTQGYLASSFAPCMVVDAETGAFYYVPFGNGRRSVSTFRDTVTGQAIRVQPGLSNGQYQTARHAVKTNLADIDLSNAMSSPAGFKALGALHAQFPGQNLAMAWEKETITFVTDTTKYLSSNVVDVSATPANQWSNPGTASPIDLIMAAALGVQKTSGIPASQLSVGMSRKMWNAAVRNPLVRDDLKYTVATTVEHFRQQTGQLALSAGVREVFVGDAVEQTSGIGTALASETDAFLWPDALFVFNRDPAPTLQGTSGSWFTAGRSVGRYDVVSGGAPWRERTYPTGDPLGTDYFAEGEFGVNAGAGMAADGTVEPVRSAAYYYNVMA